VISAFAVAGTVANFLYTQWALSRREIATWRREELQKLVANILQLSASRQGGLNDAYEAYESHYQRFPGKRPESPVTNQVGQMELVVEQIRLLDDQVADHAATVWNAHKSAEWDYQTSEPT